MKALLLLAVLLVSQNAPPEFGSVGGQVRVADGSPASNVRVAAMPVEHMEK